MSHTPAGLRSHPPHGNCCLVRIVVAVACFGTLLASSAPASIILPEGDVTAARWQGSRVPDRLSLEALVWPETIAPLHLGPGLSIMPEALSFRAGESELFQPHPGALCSPELKASLATGLKATFHDEAYVFTRAELSVASRSEPRLLLRDRQETDDDSLGSPLLARDVEGNLRGQVSLLSTNDAERMGIEGIKVFIVRGSKVVAEAISDENGEIVLEDVPPGTYAVCGSGGSGFLAFGITVLGRSEVGASEVAPGREVLTSLASGVKNEPRDRFDVAVVPPAFRTLRRIMSRFLEHDSMAELVDDEPRFPEAGSLPVAGDLNISLTPDGTLVGRMLPLTNRRDKPARLREMNAFLIQDDEIYARVPVDENGAFTFVDVDPGVYSFAAAGEEGFAAISFRAVAPSASEDATALQSTPTPGYVFTSAPKSTVAASLQITLASPFETPFLAQQLEASFQASQANTSNNSSGASPSPLNSGSSGSGGGGGGGAGGGGLGGLGAALGSAAFAAGLGGGGNLGDFPNPPNFDAPFEGGGGDVHGDGAPVPEPTAMLAWLLTGLSASLGFWAFRRRTAAPS